MLCLISISIALLARNRKADCDLRQPPTPRVIALLEVNDMKTTGFEIGASGLRDLPLRESQRYRRAARYLRSCSRRRGVDIVVFHFLRANASNVAPFGIVLMRHVMDEADLLASAHRVVTIGRAEIGYEFANLAFVRNVPLLLRHPSSSAIHLSRRTEANGRG